MSDDDSGSEGYVHRPGDAASGESETAAAGSEAAAATESVAATGREETAENGTDAFGAKGWVLVGVLVVSVLVVPGIVYLYPTAPSDAGFSFVAAMLVLPMVPAVLLGLAAVWSMTAATGEE